MFEEETKKSYFGFVACETEERLLRTTADVRLAEEATARSSCCGVITLSQLASILKKLYKI